MEDKLLIGNEIIEKALAEANANMCHETMNILRSMKADKNC